MPRGMDERFEDPNEDTEDEQAAETAAVDPQVQEPTDGQATREDPGRTDGRSSEDDDTTEGSDEPLNIREDWDSATIYVEPEQSEDIEITFTRLKKQLQRDGYVLEKNKHFYRAVFEVAFEEHREETKEKIREIVKRDLETSSSNQ